MNEWHKSSYSGARTECVEVRERVEAVDVRDTQNRDAGHLSVPATEWAALLRSVRSGEL